MEKYTVITFNKETSTIAVCAAFDNLSDARRLVNNLRFDNKLAWIHEGNYIIDINYETLSALMDYEDEMEKQLLGYEIQSIRYRIYYMEIITDYPYRKCI